MASIEISKKDKMACEAVLARHKAMTVLCDGNEELAASLATAVAIEHAQILNHELLVSIANSLNELIEEVQALREE